MKLATAVLTLQILVKLVQGSQKLATLDFGKFTDKSIWYNLGYWGATSVLNVVFPALLLFVLVITLVQAFRKPTIL
ncbi:hypothetical protein C5O19_18215 [Siphonobacter curvatus]|uniref:Uncharacterized protein n=2 Tax=Siphonobacter curvatus TaxID=2094562 RepID=A0A2S7IIR1_9BACT|nr:hypothetical protein C5O19_18215 [Siphonobacter curvatus]